GGPDADTGGLPRHSLLIRGAPFASLVVEVDSVPGLEPDEQNQDDLDALLATLVDKPAGIEIVRDGALDSRGADHAWTFAELMELADATFDRPMPDDAIAVHTMFIDGHSADDGDGGVILGIAWSHTHIAIFEETIRDMCAGSALPPLLAARQCRGAELAIWTHEVGHLLGLVDNGLPMEADHRDPDPDHGAHDASDACVMYHAYEGEALFDLIGDQLLGGGGAEVPFDQACLADLAAERAR
ncbi:MAG TPA: hypothetical protein VFU21_26220, partial [Kofleriaceae bacterium]|nr:hypothetical protein [Kofleriaceae bacterium]